MIDEAFEGWNRGELIDSEIEEIFFELKVCDADIERINDYSDELQKIYDNDKKIKVIDDGDYGFTYDDVVFLSEQYYHPAKYPAPLSEDIKSKYSESVLEKIQ